MPALRVVPASRVAMDTSSLLIAFGPLLTFQAPAPKLIISDEFNRGVNSVFSLNFSSTGKGPFMAGKAENMPQRCTFQGGKEWSEGHGLTLGGAKFFETSLPHFKTYFT